MLRYSFSRKFSNFLIIITSGMVVSLLGMDVSGATAGWQAGYIISDEVFKNDSSMSVNQIQSFLNSKIFSCDTTGTKPANDFGRPDLTHAQYASMMGWPAPPYTCLKDYRENNLSAAQIIYNISREYGLNPQVFIVLLQKEQGLVTDTWPLSSQYKKAAGYGCPDDGSGCDSKYYGFTKQLYWAATLFHTVIYDDQNWSNPYASGTTWFSPYIVGNNYIQYNPEDSCGGSIVNVKNRATQALYNYTPYQPNAATIAAAMGQTVSCGAYGNINFFRYFTSWFGSTYVPTVFKTNNSDKIYLFNDNKYYHIPSMDMLAAYGFKTSDVGVVTSNMLDLYQPGGSLSNITRIDGGDAIYLVDKGKLSKFASNNLYNAYGYTVSGNEQNLSSTITEHLSFGSDLTDVVMSSGGIDVYTLASGKKSHISSYVAFTTMGNPIYSTRAITVLSSAYINSLATGAPIIQQNAIVKDLTTNNIYFWNGTDLQQISNGTVNEAGVDIDYSSTAVGLLPLSPNSTVYQLVKDANNKTFLINNGQKFEVPTTSLSTFGPLADDFTSLSESVLSRIPTPTTQFVGLFRINNGSSVFMAKDGKRNHITSPDALKDSGFNFSQVVSLSSRSANIFPDSGNKILAQGQLFRVNKTDPVYVINSSNTSLHIPSVKLFSPFGLNTRNILNLTPQQAAIYPNSGSLSFFVKDSLNNVWQIDNSNQKRQVLSEISGSNVFNISTSNLPVLGDSLLNRYSTDASLTNLIQVAGQKQVYKIENGTRRWITTRSAFDALGLKSSNIRLVSENFKNSITIGSPIE